MKKYDSYSPDKDDSEIFVLGSSITGLSLMRIFGRKGLKVYGLDHDPKACGLISKYCTPILHPNPRNSEKKYINFLLELGKKLNKKGVLFPTSDIEALAILKNKKILEDYYHFTLADYNITNTLINKELFFKKLEQTNILYPKTFYPKKVTDLFEVDKKICYPCLIKPKYSALFRIAFKKKCFIANNFYSMKKYFKLALSRKKEVIIQEMIKGEANNMYGYNAYYDRNRRLHKDFSYNRIRQWPPIVGNGCLLKENPSAKFKKIINPLIKKINYFGLIDAEFKKDEEDNKYYLIEINPRAWMQIGFPARIGYDHAFIAYLDAINKKTKFNKNEYIDKWLLFNEDIYSAFKDICRKRLSIKEYIISMMGKKEKAYFCWDDPLPFFKSLSRYVYMRENGLKI